jgi:hypothetical protein
VEVVADLHLRPYYGDEDETDGLYHSEAKRGTTAFHAYATLYARVKNKRYTLAVRRLVDGDMASSVLAEFLGLLDGLDNRERSPGSITAMSATVNSDFTSLLNPTGRYTRLKSRGGIPPRSRGGGGQSARWYVLSRPLRSTDICPSSSSFRSVL